eukprot:2066896-Prymnesium_polylepis.1
MCGRSWAWFETAPKPNHSAGQILAFFCGGRATDQGVDGRAWPARSLCQLPPEAGSRSKGSRTNARS